MYPCIAVEHSYNCMVLLCRLFLGLSRHYTNLNSKIGTLGTDNDAVEYMKYAWLNDRYTLVVHFKDGKERYLYFDT